MIGGCHDYIDYVRVLLIQDPSQETALHSMQAMNQREKNKRNTLNLISDSFNVVLCKVKIKINTSTTFNEHIRISKQWKIHWKYTINILTCAWYCASDFVLWRGSNTLVRNDLCSTLRGNANPFIILKRRYKYIWTTNYVAQPCLPSEYFQ